MQIKNGLLSGVRNTGNKLKESAMVLLFAALAIFLTIASGQTLAVSLQDILTRFFRNFLIVIALILPINAGIGLNFGIVLGALASQVALIITLATGQYATTGISYALWIILTVVLCVVFGYFLALLFNATKGQEMISGLFVSFLAVGVYMIILNIILGKIFPVSDPTLVAKVGEGIKTTISLPPAMYQGLDSMVTVNFKTFIYVVGIAFLLYSVISIIKRIRAKEHFTGLLIAALVITAVCAYLVFNKQLTRSMSRYKCPVVTILIGVAVAALTGWLMKTKLGHDFLSIRSDRAISASVGINVDRTRMVAIILSTILAGLGQLVYIQNVGTLNTYGMHNSLSTFAIAAILIGGATIDRANVKNALLGTVIFHCIYSAAPNATKNLLGNTQLGEYFRMFLCYGVIAVAIVLYALKEVRLAKSRVKGTEREQADNELG